MFAQVQSGYSWMQKTNIACATVANGWDFANEGYNAKFNNVAFWDFLIGVRPASFIDLAISYGIYQTMHYEKYQTGESATVGFTGNRRQRFFDLDHKNILFNIIVHPTNKNLSLNLSNLKIFPFIGTGIGAGFNQVGNFYTVAYSTDDEIGVGSVTTLGQRCNSSSFAWQANIGLTFSSIRNNVSFDIGYRYYNGGKFRSANNFMINTLDYAGKHFATPGWQGIMSTNQLIFAFRFDF